MFLNIYNLFHSVEFETWFTNYGYLKFLSHDNEWVKN